MKYLTGDDSFLLNETNIVQQWVAMKQKNQQKKERRKEYNKGVYCYLKKKKRKIN